MAKLADIAQRVGVSVSTVSLVLSGHAEGRVRPDSADRIREVADELGYLPNLHARGLRTRQTKTIGLLADRVATAPFAGEMLAGAQEAAWAAGYILLLVDTAGNPEMEAPAINSLLQRNVDALIIATHFYHEVDLPAVPLPTVVLDGRPSRPDGQADSVVPDESAGGYQATQYLIDAGHRRIGMCNLPTAEYVAARLRRRGYEAALAAHGIPLDESLVVEATEATAAAGREAADRLLGRADGPTAVFCASDQIAFGLYQVAHRLGLEIPTDLSVVGFDNQIAVAENLEPGLTTMQLPHREMGVWAAEQTISRIRGEATGAPVHRLVPCPIVERGSVAPPSGAQGSSRPDPPISPWVTTTELHCAPATHTVTTRRA